MELQTITCASCNAPIRVPPDIDTLNCSYCGASLVVQRGEGYVVARIAEEMGKAVRDTGVQTQATIREGAQLTQIELKRLQLGQDLALLHTQLSSTQAEIRALERSRKSGRIRRQLRELRAQEQDLRTQVASLQSALSNLRAPSKASSSPSPESRRTTPTASTKRGCANSLSLRALWRSGCAPAVVAWLVATFVCGLVAMPLDEAVFNTAAEDSGPLFSIAIVLGLATGILAFFYVRHPDGRLWQPIKRLTPSRRREQEQSREEDPAREQPPQQSRQ